MDMHPPDQVTDGHTWWYQLIEYPLVYSLFAAEAKKNYISAQEVLLASCGTYNAFFACSPF